MEQLKQRLADYPFLTVCEIDFHQLHIVEDRWDEFTEKCEALFPEHVDVLMYNNRRESYRGKLPPNIIELIYEGGHYGHGAVFVWNVLAYVPRMLKAHSEVVPLKVVCEYINFQL